MTDWLVGILTGPMVWLVLLAWYTLIEVFVFALSRRSERLPLWAALVLAVIWPVFLAWLGAVATVRLARFALVKGGR